MSHVPAAEYKRPRMIHLLQLSAQRPRQFLLPPPHVSGLKMRNLLLGFILGLLAVVHSTPVNTVTQIPVKADDDFIQEAVTEGFLINPSFLSSLTTESPKRNTTIPASQQPSSDAEESDTVEGSAINEISQNSITSVFIQHVRKHYATTQAFSDSKDTIEGSGNPNSDLPTTQSPQSGLTSPLVPNEARVTTTRDHILISRAIEPSVDGDIADHNTTASNKTKTYSASSTPIESVQQSTADTEGSEIEDERIVGQPHPTSAQSKAHTTPGWIIIVAFIVGVAALVMLCAAIATRDKWNRPNQEPQPETKTNSSNQQRELEMQTFLNKDVPRENGTSTEYTVIPLDEFPEGYSSH